MYTIDKPLLSGDHANYKQYNAFRKRFENERTVCEEDIPVLLDWFIDMYVDYKATKEKLDRLEKREQG